MDIRKIRIILYAVSLLLLGGMAFFAFSSHRAWKEYNATKNAAPPAQESGWQDYTDEDLREVMTEGFDFLDEEERYRREVEIEEELERRHQARVAQLERDNAKLLETRLALEDFQREEEARINAIMDLASVPRDLPVPDVTSTLALRALNRAMTQIGKPYVWGAVGPDTYDCSGLVLWAYNQEGYHQMPRTTRGQWTRGALVRRDGIQRGDLIYFLINESKSPVDHVGIYLGEGRMLHAPRPGAFVEVASIPWANVASIRRHFEMK